MHKFLLSIHQAIYQDWSIFSQFALMGSPDSSADVAESYVERILACYSELASLHCLDPSREVVYKAFEQLVSLCIQVPKAEVSQKVCAAPWSLYITLV